LEPLLILGGLLPALVGRAGADQIDVGADVLAVLAGPVAGAVGAQAEVVGGDRFRRRSNLGWEVAALKTYLAGDRTGFAGSPELLPLGKALERPGVRQGLFRRRVV